MNYQEAIAYMYRNLPMYSRIGPAALKPGLGNTLELCRRLGHPEKEFRSIHIAGTNGKGSSSHMLSSIFQEAGYKTGLYTSPHLKSFTERIKINGINISESEVAQFVSANQFMLEEIAPSFFEMTVGMAFRYFADQEVDIAVIEVGLGGRLDSTNVILPDISLITNISYDHQALLGDTLTLIAGEKAGIIKPGVPVVIGETQGEIKSVFLEKAEENKCAITFADELYSIDNVSILPESISIDVYKKGNMIFENLLCGLAGQYQLKNIVGVIAAVEVLKNVGWRIEHSDIVKGLRNVVANTGLKGRWQVLQKAPWVVCDTGHNEAGIMLIVNQIKRYTFNRLIWIFGTVNDKDIKKILTLLPREGYYIFTQANIPRALDAQTLFQMSTAEGLQGEVVKDVNEALKTGLKKASSNDFVMVGGSTFVVAEIEGL